MRFIRPGQPLRRVVTNGTGVVHDCHQILGGTNAVGAAGLDHTHQQVAHCRALLADVAEEADSMFQEALSEHAHGDRAFERARTELAYGASLRRQRRRVDAREHLRAALETFDTLYATPWSSREHEEVRDTLLQQRLMECQASSTRGRSGTLYRLSPENTS